MPEREYYPKTITIKILYKASKPMENLGIEIDCWFVSNPSFSFVKQKFPSI